MFIRLEFLWIEDRIPSSLVETCPKLSKLLFLQLTEVLNDEISSFFHYAEQNQGKIEKDV